MSGLIIPPKAPAKTQEEFKDRTAPSRWEVIALVKGYEIQYLVLLEKGAKGVKRKIVRTFSKKSQQIMSTR